MSRKCGTPCEFRARRSLSLLGFLLTVTFSAQALALDETAQERLRRRANNPSLGNLGEPADTSRLRNTLTFGVGIGGVWGGAYAAERNITGNGALQVVYDDGHTEPVDFTLWTGSLFAAYEYGSADLRLQLTFLARIDSQSYSAGGEGYEPLSGIAAISRRYGLLIGPAVTLAEGAMSSLDAGLGVGPVLGSHQPLAGAADSVATVLGEMNVNRPPSHQLTGVGGRVWLSGMVWGPDRKFGIGIGIYYDLAWLHADLPDPWPRIWSDQSFGVMLPVASRF